MNKGTEAEIKRLTQYSSSSGCGCKISPTVLSEIISKSGNWAQIDEKLLVGNSAMDDACVYQLPDGNALVSTVDFFTAIVDDPYDFGRIAAANAISDVYAMGAKPLFANALLGWPVDELGTDMAAKVMEGAKSICEKAGIVIAGGHSIAVKEPIFGLTVNGICDAKNIKRNNTAEEGDLIYLTKPLGIGVLSTAIKREKISTADYKKLIEIACDLNVLGEVLGQYKSIHAMTDVTGFGFLGHLLEMCKGSGISAEINIQKIPLIEGVEKYIAEYVFPDNTWKNWNACESETEGVEGLEMVNLCDPQTSGGLLIAVAPSFRKEFEQIADTANTMVYLVGRFTEMRGKKIGIVRE